MEHEEELKNEEAKKELNDLSDKMTSLESQCEERARYTNVVRAQVNSNNGIKTVITIIIYKKSNKIDLVLLITMFHFRSCKNWPIFFELFSKFLCFNRFIVLLKILLP